MMLTARAAERGHFIPLRCSQNIGVYDENEENPPRSGKFAYFPVFERRMGHMINFFRAEIDGFFDARAKATEGTISSDKHIWNKDYWNSNETKLERWSQLLLEDSLLFNQKAIAEARRGCTGNSFTTDLRSADSKALLEIAHFSSGGKPN
jgi:hypothetical protein